MNNTLKWKILNRRVDVCLKNIHFLEGKQKKCGRKHKEEAEQYSKVIKGFNARLKADERALLAFETKIMVSFYTRWAAVYKEWRSRRKAMKYHMKQKAESAMQPVPTEESEEGNGHEGEEAAGYKKSDTSPVVDEKKKEPWL